MLHSVEVKRAINPHNDVLLDCYYVISQYRPMLAEAFYNNAQVNKGDKNMVLFTAKTPRMLIGMLGGQLHTQFVGNPFATIDYFFVDRDYRYEGVGTLLLDAYESYVLGCPKVERIKLQTTPDAQRFYESRGYMMGDGFYKMYKNLSR